jgi:hypothetical protein
LLVRKALIVKPQKRDDSDLGDVIALARSVGKQVLKTKENVLIGLTTLMTIYRTSITSH